MLGLGCTASFLFGEGVISTGPISTVQTEVRVLQDQPVLSRTLIEVTRLLQLLMRKGI
ncbi:unnamed protein product [Staurois parvus]|uniref:Uncharacterized protein n=1 Tax=Staurois parvus TaxID=386267 RepID=A0ABN9GGJ5_9NEOB|nr:unnamed protein product [Staurois parvus]